MKCVQWCREGSLLVPVATGSVRGVGSQRRHSRPGLSGAMSVFFGNGLIQFAGQCHVCRNNEERPCSDYDSPHARTTRPHGSNLKVALITPAILIAATPLWDDGLSFKDGETGGAAFAFSNAAINGFASCKDDRTKRRPPPTAFGSDLLHSWPPRPTEHRPFPSHPSGSSRRRGETSSFAADSAKASHCTNRS